MIIIKEPISIKTIKEKHNHFFKRMVKIVIDVKKEIIALDGEMHADLEGLLLNKGSRQNDLWGANTYFDKPHDPEYTSLINIRPAQRNRSMEVQDEKIRKKMRNIIQKLITT